MKSASPDVAVPTGLATRFGVRAVYARESTVNSRLLVFYATPQTSPRFLFQISAVVGSLAPDVSIGTLLVHRGSENMVIGLFGWVVEKIIISCSCGYIYLPRAGVYILWTSPPWQHTIHMSTSPRVQLTRYHNG